MGEFLKIEIRPLLTKIDAKFSFSWNEFHFLFCLKLPVLDFLQHKFTTKASLLIPQTFNQETSYQAQEPSIAYHRLADLSWQLPSLKSSGIFWHTMTFHHGRSLCNLLESAYKNRRNCRLNSDVKLFLVPQLQEMFYESNDIVYLSKDLLFFAIM